MTDGAVVHGGEEFTMHGGHTSPARVYVASSWRNGFQPTVVTQLRAKGISVYDFRNPPNKSGFGWEQVANFYKDCPTCYGDGHVDTPAADTTCPQCHGKRRVKKSNTEWTPDEYLEVLKHPIALAGFDSDIAAVRQCYVCVLVQPCGRSAHLELGYAAALGKRCAVLLQDGQEPELMLKVAEYFTNSIHELVNWVSDLKGL